MQHSAKHMRLMRSKIFNHMLQTRGWKYKVFLKQLKFFKYIALAPVRGEFLESYYALMRYLDDIVDGDVSVPESYNNVTTYILDKIKFAQNPINPQDEADYLLLHCYSLAKKIKHDFSDETSDILESLLFDANRRDKFILFPKEELAWHFHVLDIRGTIRATLKIFNDNPDKYKLLEPLGTACRYQYDLEDFKSDVAMGYINIPLETCELYNITAIDIVEDHPNVNKWIRQHAQDGMKLLEDHHRMMPKGNFSMLEKLVFQYVYEKPARKVFKQVLAETHLKPQLNFVSKDGRK